MNKQNSSDIMMAATPVRFIRCMVEAYYEAGVPNDSLFIESGIPPEFLEDEMNTVTADQFERAAAATMKDLKDEGLGWFSRKLPWGTFGMLCGASLQTATLGDALELWFRHHAILTKDILFSFDNHIRSGIEFNDRPPAAVISINERVIARDEIREFLLFSYIRIIHGYACWILDRNIPVSGVGLPFQRPKNSTIYDVLYAGKVEFGAIRPYLSFDVDFTKKANKRDRNDLKRMLKRPLVLPVYPYRQDRQLVDRIRRVLIDRGLYDSSADFVASTLNMSVRSLHRQLCDEGTSFQKVKDALRKEKAVILLKSTKKPIKQIAYQVGFSSEKSFSRAFKYWTSYKPSEFRQ